VSQAHLEFAGVSSSSLGLAVAFHLGVLMDLSPGGPQVEAHFQGPIHLSDTDHMVGWLEDKWTMVVEFLMTLLVDLLEDIRVLEDIHFHPILCCTYHCQSLVDQNFGHTGPAKMVVEVPHVLGNYCKQGRLVDHHILLHVQVGVVLVGRKGDILVRVDHPFLDGVVEPVWDLRLEGSCCSWEGSQCNHLENCQ